jgi:hypothetical protein
MALRDDRGGALLRRLPRADRQTLSDYFDTSKYVSDKSDIVALLMLEHQAFIHNLITRVNYKVQTVMSRAGRATAAAPQSWEEVGQKDQALVKVMIEPLVRALFFADAAPLTDQISSSSGFDKWYARQGPRDAKGRSLRDLDLGKRLLRYRLSPLVYSEHFDALPDYALDYIAGRMAEVLSGKDRAGIASGLSADERAAISVIIRETKPLLAARMTRVSTSAAQ